jgi:hypothetical protein
MLRSQDIGGTIFFPRVRYPAILGSTASFYQILGMRAIRSFEPLVTPERLRGVTTHKTTVDSLKCDGSCFANKFL